MSDLRIKHFGTENNYSILSNKVKIIEKNWSKSTEYYINFDNLGFDLINEKSKIMLWVPVTHFLFMCLQLYVLFDEFNKGAKILELIGWTCAALMFGTFFVFSLIQKTEIVYLTGGEKVIELNASKPNTEKVYSFIDQLHSKMRIYFKTKYGRSDLPIEKETSISNFLWLKEIQAINENEYEELVREIDLKSLL